MNKERIYKTLIIFLLSILLSNLLFAQGRKKNDQITTNRPFYFEVHIVPVDTSLICNLSYKISYNSLLFVKENAHYSSGYSITFEVYENLKFVKRVMSTGKVSTQTYANTLNENLYHEGLISFDLAQGEFLIKPSVILNNTTIETRIKPINCKVDSSQINKPIFVKSEKLLCDSVKYRLVNFQNSLPFSVNKFDMLIPTYQKFENPVKIEISQNDKIILNKEISDYELLNQNLTRCKEGIVLCNSSDLPLIKYYKVSFINQKLIEGKFEVKLEIGEKNINFTIPVLWYDKPKSLLNIEKAIEYLEIIGLKQSADSLLDFSEEDEYDALVNFWKKFDDDDKISFNKIFYEFYKRIDYAQAQFSSLGENDGAVTDRGRIYVLYGEPDNIERMFNNPFDVIEIWEYKSINMKIYFSDKTGTGKFERIK